MITEEAIDFIDKVLIIDHQERLTAAEAMKHPYFNTKPSDKPLEENLVQQKFINEISEHDNSILSSVIPQTDSSSDHPNSAIQSNTTR